MPQIDSGAALAIALGCAYLAGLVAMLWPTSHLCHDNRCNRWQREHTKRED